MISLPHRLLIVVRDPVTRAISDYTQAASKKADMKRFEQLAFVNGSYSVVDTNWGPVKIGVYARFLEKAQSITILNNPILFTYFSAYVKLSRVKSRNYEILLLLARQRTDIVVCIFDTYNCTYI